jgi:hypothetical protein
MWSMLLMIQTIMPVQLEHFAHTWKEVRSIYLCPLGWGHTSPYGNHRNYQDTPSTARPESECEGNLTDYKKCENMKIFENSTTKPPLCLWVKF